MLNTMKMTAQAASFAEPEKADLWTPITVQPIGVAVVDRPRLSASHWQQNGVLAIIALVLLILGATEIHQPQPEVGVAYKLDCPLVSAFGFDSARQSSAPTQVCFWAPRTP